MSSHAQIWPQGAEKQLSKVNVGVEGKHREQLLLFALAGDLEEQSLSICILFPMGFDVLEV